jgi:DNA replication protein DnaC
MNLIELDRALRQLRLGGMAAVLETRLRQAQAEAMAPIDLMACLVSDELTLRTDRLLQRRRKQAAFRDADRTLDNFDFTFNPKMNCSLVFDLATGAFINKRENALFLGPGGTGKSHLAQAIGQCAIQQGYKVLYRETHILLDELADAITDDRRKEYMESVATVPLLIIDDFGMRKLPHTAAEDLLEIIMRRYARFSTLLTSNRLCGAPHKRFNAESIFMRTPRSMEGARGHVAVFLLRILGAAFSISISLSVALKRPVRSFGAITDSRASSFTHGSARV